MLIERFAGFEIIFGERRSEHNTSRKSIAQKVEVDSL